MGITCINADNNARDLQQLHGSGSRWFLRVHTEIFWRVGRSLNRRERVVFSSAANHIHTHQFDTHTNKHCRENQLIHQTGLMFNHSMSAEYIIGVSLNKHQSHHFSKDAAYTPDVHWSGVILWPQQQLRWPVPQRHHLQKSYQWIKYMITFNGECHASHHHSSLDRGRSSVAFTYIGLRKPCTHKITVITILKKQL